MKLGDGIVSVRFVHEIRAGVRASFVVCSILVYTFGFGPERCHSRSASGFDSCCAVTVYLLYTHARCVGSRVEMYQYTLYYRESALRLGCCSFDWKH